MPRVSPPAELLAPVPPFEAYRDDVARLSGRAPLGASDDVWLLTAHSLARAASLEPQERPALLAAAAEAIESLGAAAAGRALRALADVIAGTGAYDRRDLATMQHFVADLEQAGAFRLAHVMLGALRATFAPALDPRCEGLLLAQQGRAARQLGALEAAREHYRAAAKLARRAGAPDVSARAQLGLGVIGNMRGNYPAARQSFRRALGAARRAGSRDLLLAAHHGLFVAAIAARDVDTALTHGWATVRRSSALAPTERADALANLAAAGYLAGEHRAALAACLAAIELTDLTRIRLPALGTAVRAAGAAGEHRILAHLARDVDRCVARSGQPYENAHALVEVAEAFVFAEEAGKAAEYAARAREIATTSGFHEIGLRAERAAEGAAALTAHRAPVAPASDMVSTGPRSTRARAVLRSMEALPAARRYASTAT